MSGCGLEIDLVRNSWVHCNQLDCDSDSDMDNCVVSDIYVKKDNDENLVELHWKHSGTPTN